MVKFDITISETSLKKMNAISNFAKHVLENNHIPVKILNTHNNTTNHENFVSKELQIFSKEVKKNKFNKNIYK